MNLKRITLLQACRMAERILRRRDDYHAVVGMAAKNQISLGDALRAAVRNHRRLVSKG